MCGTQSLLYLMTFVVAAQQNLYHFKLPDHGRITPFLMIMGMEFISNTLFIRSKPQSATGKQIICSEAL